MSLTNSYEKTNLAEAQKTLPAKTGRVRRKIILMMLIHQKIPSVGLIGTPYGTYCLRQYALVLYQTILRMSIIFRKKLAWRSIGLGYMVEYLRIHNSINNY